MDGSNKPPEGTGNNVKTLNALLRSELAAVETYDQAMSKFEDRHVLADLHSIREEHVQLAAELRDKIVGFGEMPVERSGAWGTCAAATSTAKNFGPATTLEALRQGEEQAINEFEGALETVNPDCKNLLLTNVLPNTRKHVDELNRLMGGM